jgi:hypothetical protein
VNPALALRRDVRLATASMSQHYRQGAIIGIHP